MVRRYECHTATKNHVVEVQLLSGTDVCEYMIGRKRQVLEHYVLSQPLFL